MDIARKIGIMVFMGVPAIIGGGIVYHFFGNYTATILFEIILLLTALGLISR